MTQVVEIRGKEPGADGLFNFFTTTPVTVTPGYDIHPMHTFSLFMDPATGLPLATVPALLKALNDADEPITLSVDDSGNLKVTLATAIDSDTDSITSVEQPASSLGHGIKNVTTAYTDEPLVASTTPCKWVILQARALNTDKIAVGSAGVDATISTGTGILLESGDSVYLDVDNLADVSIDARVNGEGVRYTYGVV